LFLLVFILENSQRMGIGHFGAHGHLPLGWRSCRFCVLVMAMAK
jgi:uncharacterized integral membrane protein